MAGNNIVTTTSNRIVYETDKNSYQRTLKQIRSIGEAWNKSSRKVKPNTSLERSTARINKAATAAAKAQNAAKKEQLAIQKKQKAQLDRNLRAENALRKSSFDIVRLQGQSLDVQQKNVQAARKITAEYKDGKIELAQMNEQLRQLKVNATSAARTQRKLAKSRGEHVPRNVNGGSSTGMGIAAATGRAIGGVGMGVAAGAAAGYAVYRNLDTASEKAHTLSQIHLQTGADPNTVLAMEQWGRQHGVDSASIDKLQDNMKDIVERAGEFSLNAERGKDGKWKGGGQFTDAANQLGLTKKDIAQFENNPLLAVSTIVNRGKKMGKTDAQINFLLENLADDLLYYRKLFENNNKELIATMNQRQADGLAYQPGDLNALENAYQFNVALKQGAEALQNNFVVGLARGISGTDDLKEAFKLLIPQMRDLGTFIGKVINGLTTLIRWLPTTKVNEAQQQVKDNTFKVNNQEVKLDGTWHDWIPAPLQRVFGVGPNSGSSEEGNSFRRKDAPLSDGLSSGFNFQQLPAFAAGKPPIPQMTANINQGPSGFNWKAYGAPPMGEQKITIKNDVSVTTNGEFGHAINAKVDSAIADYDQKNINMLIGEGN